MTGAEFKRARQSLGLTQEQLARVMGYGSASRIAELEARDTIKGPPARLMQVYLRGTRPDDWPG